ncbi:DUF1007 family protein [Vibrio maritimus]
MPHRLLLFLIVVVYPVHSYAHPHSWIGNELKVNGEGSQVDSITMTWTFDPFSSAYALDGDFSVFDNQKSAQQEALRLMRNLLNTHYFTYLYAGGTPLKFRLPEVYSLSRKGRRMVLNFTLPLSRLVDLNKEGLDIQVFDNTYYIDISWKNHSTITLDAALSSECRFDLITPTPSQDIVDYAMSLGVDDVGDDDLGSHFSQKVSLSCGS